MRIPWEELVERKLRENEDADSHTEIDTSTFHPSQISKCKRQCVISKFGLEEHSLNTLWNFHIGTERHEWFEEEFGDYPGLEFEKRLVSSHDGVKFTGHCDVYDHHENVVYDFKTQKGWGYFDGTAVDDLSQRHVDQITVYMDAVGADAGYIVYVVKSAPWDDDEPIIQVSERIAYNPNRMQMLVDKAKNIEHALEGMDGYPESHEDVPFEKCGCFICSSEDD